MDSAFSLEPEEFASLVLETGRAWKSLGHIQYGATEQEKRSLSFRRSLYVTKDIEAGCMLSTDNLRTIRPGFGLPPKFYDLLLGRRVNRAVKAGTPVSWELFI